MQIIRNGNSILILTHPYYGHVTGQNLSSPTTDDAFVVWTYSDPTSNSKKNTGTISFVAYADGEVTVVYGCTNSNESVKLIKSNQVIDETTEVKNHLPLM